LLVMIINIVKKDFEDIMSLFLHGGEKV
jgi:hypothetical protein